MAHMAKSRTLSPTYLTSSYTDEELRCMSELESAFAELGAIEEEERRRAEEKPARRYIPNGKAAEFIAMVGSGKSFVNLFLGANATGKTATGVNIIANIVYGPQNEYFKHEIFERWPYQKRGRIISDPTTIKEKIIPELKKWFPHSDAKRVPDAPYETAKEGANFERKFRTNNGWEIDLMSNEQDVKEFESVDLGFVWIDEPMPKDRFIATIARGRMGMIIFWGITPLTYSAWIKDWLDAHSGKEEADYIEVEMEDNCITHGVRGILDHANIKRIASAIPEDEREARVFGKFGHLIGRVHKLFRRKVHVIRPFPLNEKDFTTYKALDPHPRVSDHALYLSVDRKGTKFLTGEIVSEGLVKELHSRMVSFESAMKYRMEGRIIDPSAFTDDQHRSENSVGQQLLTLGEHYIAGSKDLMAGIKRTNDALSYQEVNGRMVKPPELYIFDTCPVTIKQLDEYVWSEWKGTSKDDKQPRATPKDVNDHQVENLHRLLLAEPVFTHYTATVGHKKVEGASGFGGPEGKYDYHDSDLDPYA